MFGGRRVATNCWYVCRWQIKLRAHCLVEPRVSFFWPPHASCSGSVAIIVSDSPCHGGERCGTRYFEFLAGGWPNGFFNVRPGVHTPGRFTIIARFSGVLFVAAVLLPSHNRSADATQKAGRKRTREMREPGGLRTAGVRDEAVTCPLCKVRATPTWASLS